MNKIIGITLAVFFLNSSITPKVSRAELIKQFNSAAEFRNINITEESVFGLLPYTRSDKTTLLSLKSEGEIIVAVLDTGIDCKNKIFKGRIWMPAHLKETHPCGISYTDKDSRDTHDHVGHGTGVASLILAVHPAIKILPMKVFKNETFTFKGYNQALRDLLPLSDKVHVVNFSGAGKEYSYEEKVLLKALSDKNVLFVNSAGNDAADVGDSDGIYPANFGHLDKVIVVGGSDRVKISPKYESNSHSSKVVISTVVDQYQYNNNGKIEGMTGTSSAAPIVAAVLALAVNQVPDLCRGDEAKKLLISTATKFKHIPSGERFNQANGELNITALFAKVKEMKAREIRRGVAGIKRK